MKLKTYLLGLGLVLFCAAGFSQTTKRKIAKRQNIQDARVNQGLRTGELTKREAIRLKQQQKDIKRSKRAAKADGKLTRKERRVIKAKQNKASQAIYRKKNNKLTKP